MRNGIKTITVLLLAFVIVLTYSLPALAASGQKNEIPVLDKSQFEGKKIAIVTGTVFGDIVSEYIENVQVKEYKSTADVIAALQSGKVDAFACDEPSLRYCLSEFEGSSIGRLPEGKETIAMTTAKTDSGRKIRSELDEFIIGLEESGELDELQYKWFSGPEEGRTIIDYNSLPDINGTLNIATDPSFPPMEYMKDNIATGYVVDIVVQFCEKYGYKPNIITVDIAGIIAGVNVGKYDIGACFYSITEERKKSVDFTEPIYISYTALGYFDEAATQGIALAGIKDSFERTFITENRWKLFASGVKVTLLITIISIALGTIIGFIMHILCRKGSRFANKAARFLRWLIKGMPEVVLLMVLFYIVFGHSSVAGEIVAIIGFSLTFACSMHAMLADSENNLDPGQYKAATALGYSEYKTFTRIILPQTARMFMPTYLTDVSQHIKATAVVGYIAVVDITKVGDVVRGSTYEAFFPLIAVAAMYFVMAGLLRWIIKLVTRKIDPTKRSREEILKGAELR